MKLFLTGDDEVAATLGFEKLKREHEKQNGLSGKAKNLDKISFKFPFAISSAVRDTVKILNEFQIRTHMKNL